MQLPGVRPSVRPIRPPHALLQVCCCGPMLARDIDRLQQQRRANAGSATLSAYLVTRHRLFLQHHYRAAFQLAIADPYQTHLLQVQKRGRAAIGRRRVT